MSGCSWNKTVIQEDIPKQDILKHVLAPTPSPLPLEGSISPEQLWNYSRELKAQFNSCNADKVSGYNAYLQYFDLVPQEVK